MFALATITLGAIGLATLSRALEPKSVGVAVAPRADEHPDAVVQVYGADVWGLRGRFAIHTWIVTKAANADRYTRYQVIGWRLRRGLPVVSITNDRPDGDWFGSAPVLLLDRRGAEAEHLVESHTRCGAPLSIRERVRDVARAQQQFVHRVDRPRSARARPRVARPRRSASRG